MDTKTKAPTMYYLYEGFQLDKQYIFRPTKVKFP